jgi:multiple sugar transport system ATP-binding protein
MTDELIEVRLDRVRKTYADTAAVDEVSLGVRRGELLSLLGPSGCGKTTTLRMVAGFVAPTAGSIHIRGQDVTNRPPYRRDTAMVFQSYALFPHLTVADNVAFGLRMRGLPGALVRRRVADAAERMRIGSLLGRYPAELSGGQRQRAAVARALVTDSSVILMDEPLSSLDALLREQMRGELKRVLREEPTTTVYVTHDQAEALSMGDRTAVMRDGRILQCDTPRLVYDRPSHVFVARFIGSPPMNVLRGTMRRREVEIEGRTVQVGAQDGHRAGEDVLIGVRAENVRVTRERRTDALEADVLVVEPLGWHTVLTLALGGQTLKAQADADFVVEPGDRVWLRLEAASLRLLSAGEG